MSTQRPTVTGGTIFVDDSTDLAALDPRGLPVGTSVWNEDVGAFFVLTVSTADLDPDVVVAVSGITGYRWIVQTSSTGTVESVTGDGVDNTDPANPVIDLDDTIETGFIKNDAVTADKIADSAIDAAAKIVDGVITAGKLEAAETLCLTLGIPGPWHVTTLVADTQNHDISSLDGNAHGDVEVFVDAIVASGKVLFCQPNAATTNQQAQAAVSDGSGQTDNTGGTDLALLDTSDGHVWSHFVLRQGISTDRIFEAMSYKGGTGATARWGNGIAAVGANLTSIRIHADSGSDTIKIGTVVKWRYLNNPHA